MAINPLSKGLYQGISTTDGAQSEFSTRQSSTANASISKDPSSQAAGVESGRDMVGAESERLDYESLKKLMQKMNIVMNAMDVQVQFAVHRATKQVMVKVVNVDTGQVIREIPPQKILDMVAKMQEMVGVLVDERA